MSTTRIKGVALKLTLGSPGVDYWADIMSLSFESEDAPDGAITFKDAADGKTTIMHMKGKAIQSVATDSFWRYVWEHSGETVAFTYAPHGNAAPSAAEPHFIGEVKIGSKPTIGGDAGQDVTYEFDFDWECTTDPVLTTGA